MIAVILYRILGEYFFEAITALPVPADMRVLRAIKRSRWRWICTCGRRGAFSRCKGQPSFRGKEDCQFNRKPAAASFAYARVNGPPGIR
jgi:hypothetical protein